MWVNETYIHRTRTNSRTFSSKCPPIFEFNCSGANSVQPHKNRSPSLSTRETDVEIASARIFDSRISSRGSVDWSFKRNSEKTESVRYPSMKSMTAWQNQSLNVEVYILKEPRISQSVKKGLLKGRTTWPRSWRRHSATQSHLVYPFYEMLRTW